MLANPWSKCLEFWIQTMAEPVSKPEGKQLVTLIPGDGVGPELMSSVKDVFHAAGVPIDFEEIYLRWVNLMSGVKDVFHAVGSSTLGAGTSPFKK